MRDDPRTVGHAPYPELTLTAVVVGYLTGSVITLSVGYASLILGFSIEGSELAAILGFGILRGILGRRSIIENNINQTVASSVNGASAGMMFSVPALFILGYTEFSYTYMVLGCLAGGVLGIAFIIPLRRQMIDYNRLAFPGGIAVAAVLRSPGAGMRKAFWLGGGALLSASAHGLTIYFQSDQWALGKELALPEVLNLTFRLSLMIVGVGYLAGRHGIFFVLGGFTCYWALAPSLSALGSLPSAETLAGRSLPEYLRIELFRPVGIGMLIGGALTGIALALPLVLGAVRSMQRAARLETSLSREELPIRLLYAAVAGAFLLLFLIAVGSTDEMTFLRGALMAVAGTIWIWVAGVVLSECIGRTNWSPLSGMTLIGVTLLIFAAGAGTTMSDVKTAIASVMVGAAMCVAMAQATDLMMDMKTGYLVGAMPRKQQIAQFLGSWLGPFLIMALIVVLHEAHGIGSEKLPAPQGGALAGIISGILEGDVPHEKYAAGALLGALLSASGIGGLGILVGLGFYLPFDIALTYVLGTALRLWSDWRPGGGFAGRTGIPLAAGLIVGEALVGVGHALWKVLGSV